MRIGVLTGGGDCPGLNAVIRAVVYKGEGVFGHEFVGFRYGWRGLIERDAVELSRQNTANILTQGGTILRSSRTNPYKSDDGVAKVKGTAKDLGIDALVVIGGEDTLGAANKLVDEGLKIVGVPKTIDNDLSATDFTFGFNTAVQIAVEAIDRLHSTGASHDRVMVAEVMGRHAGWIATYAGMAAGATVILVPEKEFDMEEVCDHLRRHHKAGNSYAVVVAAEGALPKNGAVLTAGAEKLDDFGHVRLGGIGEYLEKEIEARTGFETRATNLGHILRGGTPTAYDRVLATRFGLEAIDAVTESDFGKMVSLSGAEVIRVPLASAVADLRTVDEKLFSDASVFFG